MKKTIAAVSVTAMIIAISVGLVSCGENLKKDPVTLKIGYVADCESVWTLMTGMEKGFFEDEGITVELREFGDSAAEAAAMEEGSIGIGCIGKEGHSLCITGGAVILASDSVRDSEKLICSANSGVRDIGDLAGKRIGYTAGSSSEAVMRAALEAAGLAEGDVRIFNLKPADIKNSMLLGELDAAAAIYPHSADILERCAGSYEIEFPSGSTDMSSWICPARYAQENREGIVRFTRALLRAMDYCSDPENAQELALLRAEDGGMSLEDSLAEWGGVHRLSSEELESARESGELEGWYGDVMGDLLAEGGISSADARDPSEWVDGGIMEDALKK